MSTFSYDSYNIKNPWLNQTENQSEESTVAKQDVTTVPIVNAKNKKTTSTLTEAGNVPISGTVNDNVGIVLERTTNTNTKVENKTETNSQNQTKKTGDSINERLSRYYEGYDKATREEKEKYLDRYITGHFKSLKGLSKEKRINLQLADYKKLLENTSKEKNGDDYEMLAARINILEKENQIPAARRIAIEENDPNMRHRGQIGIARTIHNCHDDNQMELTQIVVDSKNEKAIEIGASNSSKLAIKNQTPAVSLYMNADISDESKVIVGKEIVNQYGDFAKENQVGIHKVVSKSKISEIVEYAADNIWHFDKSNQKAAVDVTIETGNEAAINKAASRANYYDESVRESIKTTFYNSGYESAKSSWDNAPAAETSSKTQTSSTSSTQQTTSTQASKDVKTTVVSQVKELMKSGSMNPSELNKILKNASAGELQEIFLSLTPHEKAQAIKVMIANGISMKELSYISDTIAKGNLSDKDKNEICKNLDQSFTTNILASQSSISNNVSFVKLMAEKGSLDKVKEQNLTGSAKQLYIELIG